MLSGKGGEVRPASATFPNNYLNFGEHYQSPHDVDLAFNYHILRRSGALSGQQEKKASLFILKSLLLSQSPNK